MALALRTALVLLISTVGAQIGRKSDKIVTPHGDIQVQSSVRPNGEIDTSLIESFDAEQTLAEIQTLVQSSDASSRPQIQAIMDMVEQLFPVLKGEKKNEEDQVALNLKVIDECNAHSTKDQEEIKASDESQVTKRRGTHKSCREEESEKEDNKNGRCGELDTYLAATEQPGDKPEGRDAIVKFVEEMSGYWCPKGPEAEKLDEACKAAEKEHAEHRASCNEKQFAFELGFCEWRTSLVGKCMDLESCYSSAVKAYTDHKAIAEELVKKWKTEWKTLKNIRCYVDVWMNNEDSSNVDAAQYEKCKTEEADTKVMEIDFGKVPEKITCDLGPVSIYPGSTNFPAQEYSFTKHALEPLICPNGDQGTKHATDVITTESVTTAEATTTTAEATTTTAEATTTTAAPKPVARIEQAAVRQSGWGGGIKCTWITFKQKFEKTPYVQVSVDHRTYKGSGTHDAVTVWMQEVYNDRFKVCVRELAHDIKGAHDNNLHISYMAFEGAPAGAQIGNASFPAYNSDYTCEWIHFAQSFNAQPHVVTTIYHQPNYGGNAVTEWAQEVQADKVRVCMRETWHHDQRHMAFHMGYLAWSQPIPDAQTGRTHFDSWRGGSSCKKIQFDTAFKTAPIVQATVNHYHREGVTHHAVSTWMEEVETTGFRACVRELKQHDGAHAALNIDWIARED
jgi:hypothetical protein